MKTTKQLPSREDLLSTFHFDFENGLIYEKINPKTMRERKSKDGYPPYISPTHYGTCMVRIRREGVNYFKTANTLEEAQNLVDNKLKELYPDGLMEIKRKTDKNGYIKFTYNNGIWALHRILYYVYHNVDIGEKQIDHIDQNKTNNSIHNLRLADGTIQNINKKRLKNNVSGERGVRHVINKFNGKDYHYWVSEVRGTRDGKKCSLHYKSFPHTDEGYLLAVEDVRKARELYFDEILATS